MTESASAVPIVAPRKVRYSAINQAFHWITALAIFAIIILGWIMEPGKDDASKAVIWEWHKTLGVLVLFMTLARLIWRRLDPPPDPAPGHGAWEHRIAQVTHILFFAALIGIPLTGYVYSTAAGHPPTLFNFIPTPALLPKDEALTDLARSLHRLSQWPLYGLLLLHFAGVFYHVVVSRDGLLGRMLPPQRELE